jgi:AP-2 complex subunit alpha
LKVLEEMPPYPEKESSLLAKLKKTKPQIDECEHNASGEKKHRPMAVMSASSNNMVCYSLYCIVN